VIRPPTNGRRQSADLSVGARLLLVAAVISGCSQSNHVPDSPGWSSPPSTTAPTTSSTQRVESPGNARAVKGSYDPIVPILVTRDDPSLVTGCRPWHAAGLVDRFFAAVNSKNAQGIEAVWALPTADSGQGWYSVTEGEPAKGGSNLVARTQDQLLTYFSGRFIAREQMHLVMTDVGQSNRPGEAAIGFVVTRDADDLATRLGGPNRLAQGKAVIDCRRQVFLVWSMAQNIGDSDSVVEAWPCPKPTDWMLWDEPIACSRGSH